MDLEKSAKMMEVSMGLTLPLLNTPIEIELGQH